jgi:hypothetical protein
MKRLIILLLLLCSPAYAEDVQVARLSRAVVGGGAPAAAPVNECDGKLLCQNFEGTGYDNSESWTESGEETYTVNEDYTSTILRGTQSLYMYAADVSTLGETKAALGATYTELYGFFRIRLVTLPLVPYSVISLFDDSANQPFLLYIDIDGSLSINHGSTEGYGTFEMSAGTTYYVWWYWQKGTGVNGVAWVKIDTDNTIPVSNDCSITAGNSAYSATKFGFIVGAYTGIHSFIIDQVLVDNAAIGDVTS